MKKHKDKEPKTPQELGTPTGFEKPVVKRTYSKRLIMLGISGTMIGIGVLFFMMYFFTLNMILGGIGLFIGAGGAILFYYYWNQNRDAIVKLVGETPKEEVNSLTIYQDHIVFENVHKPGGFLWQCINDGKHYFVNWWNPVKKLIEPFVLPDQQYYDPQVFAERVLTLPAHRKIFTKKQDLLHKLRPVFLFVIAVAIWILIMTTTGNGGG